MPSWSGCNVPLKTTGFPSNQTFAVAVARFIYWSILRFSLLLAVGLFHLFFQRSKPRGLFFTHRNLARIRDLGTLGFEHTLVQVSLCAGRASGRRQVKDFPRDNLVPVVLLLYTDLLVQSPGDPLVAYWAPGLRDGMLSKERIGLLFQPCKGLLRQGERMVEQGQKVFVGKVRIK